MILYRFQDAKGNGPWTGEQGAYFYAEVRECGDHPSTMTCPADDEGEELRAWWRAFPRPFEPWFATSSIEQLLRWFPCSIGRAKMRELGYVLVELDCPREFCVVGDTQVVYNKPYARGVRTYDIVTLEEVK